MSEQGETQLGLFTAKEDARMRAVWRGPTGTYCMVCNEMGAREPHEIGEGRYYELNGEQLEVKRFGWAHPECIDKGPPQGSQEGKRAV